jgi:hypothetical protein
MRVLRYPSTTELGQCILGISEVKGELEDVDMFSEQIDERTRNVGVNGLPLLIDSSWGCASLSSRIEVFLSSKLLAR